jgi:hypothetical protein
MQDNINCAAGMRIVAHSYFPNFRHHQNLDQDSQLYSLHGATMY